jgi:hypothetical protein
LDTSIRFIILDFIGFILHNYLLQIRSSFSLVGFVLEILNDLSPERPALLCSQ